MIARFGGGGPLDGTEATLSFFSELHKSVLAVSCAVHGIDGDDCECGEAMWYCYRDRAAWPDNKLWYEEIQ